MANEQRLIDANALIESKWWDSLKDDFDKARAKIIVQSCPTVDAVEVVHGEWLDGYGVCDNKKSYISIDCSNCGEYFKLPSIDENIEEWKKRFAYCPFCGAMMDGGNEDGG